MKLAHISDIHWRGLARHKEYIACFNQLFEELRQEVKPDYIICTGDWFHTKTVAITPEIIEKLTWVFRELSNIAPLIGILGNHDGNLANEDRQDTITPIVDAIGSPRINIFKKTGVYEMADGALRVGVLSPFDKADWDGTLKEFLDGQADNKVSVCLYHGSVVGCVTDSDWVMTKGAEQSMAYFTGIDFGLFGDIHQQQFLSFREDKFGNQKPNVAYPGSLIQQNYGESTVKGYLVWDIRSRDDWNVEFHRLHNPYSFITVQWRGSVFETIAALVQEHGSDLSGKSIRVMSRNTIFDVQKTDMTQQLRSKHKAVEVVYRFDKKRTTSNVIYSDDEVDGEDLFNTYRTNGQQGVSMQETVAKALRKYVADNSDAVHVVPGSSTEKTMVELALKYFEKLDTNSEQTRDVMWSLKNMTFSNLYKFGEDNSINFAKMRGITGIFGGNASGKSSLIGAMMFGLFNTTDRGPVKAAHIINRNEVHGSVEILFDVNGTDYVLRREISKARTRKGVDHDKAAGKLYFAKVDISGNEIDLSPENAETRSDTDKVIRNLIGSASDYLMTGLAAQGEMNKFINEGPTARKQMISRFLDLRVYDDIFKLANEDLNVINAKTHRFRGVDFGQQLASLCSNHDKLEEETTELKEEIAAIEEELAQVKSWLQSNNSSKVDDIVRRKQSSDEAVVVMDRKRQTCEADLQQGKDNIRRLEEMIAEKTIQLSAIEDESSLLEKKRKFAELNERLALLSRSEYIGKALRKKQEESVKRLQLVPCGDQYLDTCKYISGAKDDREQLERTNAELSSVVQSISDLNDEINRLHAENVDATLKARHAIVKSIEETKNKLALAESEKVYKEKLLESSIAASELAYAENAAVTAEHAEIVAKVEETASKHKELAKLQAELAKAQTALHENMKSIGATANRLHTLEQDKLEAEKLLSEQKILDAICVAFSKNAIPAMVIESVLPYINAELDNILGGVAPFRVYLKTEVGNANILDVYIEDEYSSRVIELASGMEKMIASLALRVALINLSRLPKPDFLVIDEGWDVLDDTNVSRAIELLSALKTKFKHILVISHVNALKEAADDFITIQNGASGEPSRVSY